MRLNLKIKQNHR